MQIKSLYLKNIFMQLFPSDLLQFKEYYEKYNFKFFTIKPEKESAEYNAHDLIINDLNIKFRSSKITPTKTGQFVTLWKRSETGPISPFESSDSIDFVIICSKNDSYLGYFIFPKAMLVEKGIFSDKKEGKRAFRVYPPWDIAQNNQAKKTQKWQLNYFLDFSKVQDQNNLESFFKV